MPSCVALGCHRRRDAILKIFPLKDQRRRQIWVDRVNRPGWTPTKFSALCDRHFDRDQWELPRQDGKRKLKDSALPTVFVVPPIANDGGVWKDHPYCLPLYRKIYNDDPKTALHLPRKIYDNGPKTDNSEEEEKTFPIEHVKVEVDENEDLRSETMEVESAAEDVDRFEKDIENIQCTPDISVFPEKGEPFPIEMVQCENADVNTFTGEPDDDPLAISDEDQAKAASVKPYFGSTQKFLFVPKLTRRVVSVPSEATGEPEVTATEVQSPSVTKPLLKVKSLDGLLDPKVLKSSLNNCFDGDSQTKFKSPPSFSNIDSRTILRSPSAVYIKEKLTLSETPLEKILKVKFPKKVEKIKEKLTFSDAPQAKKLKIQFTKKLKNIKGKLTLSEASQEKDLEIQFPKRLENIEDKLTLSEAPQEKDLEIQFPKKLENIKDKLTLSEAPQVKNLEIQFPKKFENIEDKLTLSEAPQVKNLEIQFTKKFENIEDKLTLSEAPQVKNLEIQFPKKFENIEDKLTLSEAPQVKNLEITGPKKLEIHKEVVTLTSSKFSFPPNLKVTSMTSAAPPKLKLVSHKLAVQHVQDYTKYEKLSMGNNSIMIPSRPNIRVDNKGKKKLVFLEYPRSSVLSRIIKPGLIISETLKASPKKSTESVTKHFEEEGSFAGFNEKQKSLSSKRRIMFERVARDFEKGLKEGLKQVQSGRMENSNTPKPKYLIPKSLVQNIETSCPKKSIIVLKPLKPCKSLGDIDQVSSNTYSNTSTLQNKKNMINSYKCDHCWYSCSTPFALQVHKNHNGHFGKHVKNRGKPEEEQDVVVIDTSESSNGSFCKESDDGDLVEDQLHQNNLEDVSNSFDSSHLNKTDSETETATEEEQESKISNQRIVKNNFLNKLPQLSNKGFTKISNLGVSRFNTSNARVENIDHSRNRTVVNSDEKEVITLSSSSSDSSSQSSSSSYSDSSDDEIDSDADVSSSESLQASDISVDRMRRLIAKKKESTSVIANKLKKQISNFTQTFKSCKENTNKVMLSQKTDSSTSNKTEKTKDCNNDFPEIVISDDENLNEKQSIVEQIGNGKYDLSCNTNNDKTQGGKPVVNNVLEREILMDLTCLDSNEMKLKIQSKKPIILLPRLNLDEITRKTNVDTKNKRINQASNSHSKSLSSNIKVAESKTKVVDKRRMRHSCYEKYKTAKKIAQQSMKKNTRKSLRNLQAESKESLKANSLSKSNKTFMFQKEKKLNDEKNVKRSPEFQTRICHLCGEKVLKSKFNNHVHKHLEKTSACTVCNEKFSHTVLLRRHMKTKHYL